MEQFKFIKNYLKNDKYRKSFNELGKKTFSINFDQWYREGYLGDNYINYSFLHEEKVVANVSANKFNIIHNGELKKAIQLGTVMTDEHYRNKGLIRKLMDTILKEYENYDLIYLFANDSVLDFYPKFGFKKVIEGKYELDAKEITGLELNNCKVIKLDLENEEHKNIIKRLAKNRVPISQELGIINYSSILNLYCNYEFRDDLYYIKEEDTIIIFRRENNVVNLFDILSSDDFDLDNIISKVIRKEDKSIQFNFIPKSKKYKINFELEENTGDTLFVKEGKGNLEDGILFPKTSHT
ncbi:GNAT family acetyltransferase [Clostridium gelidum]|uniref:GNAT family acetyltransferase n=1 Tax=Clostridium gelidum TaxID=704125 RepID=A0ABN6IYT8_9CLOT|nr:GNAT family N-acetyltransferase [Clostridium gelidum]BCZ46073.1 GNAT family acetyltransferase [Clostridium gelidum]